MTHAGDSYTFTLLITSPTGATINVTTVPSIQIVNASNGTTMLSSAATMTLITGSHYLYTYNWAIPSGAPQAKYVGLVSYVANGNIFNSVPIETVLVGDSYISGPVALAATVALNATVAKDATVAHVTDLISINPENSPIMAAIKAKTDLIPTQPAAVSDVQAVQTDTQLIKGMLLADIDVNRTALPRVLTYTYNGQVLASYTLVDDSSSSGRTRL